MSKAQAVINDAGSRLSFSIEKKLNDKFSVFGKIQGRQAENFRLLNRVYIRLGIDYNLNDHFAFSLYGNYMQSRNGFYEMSPSFRYAIAASYKRKFTERFTFINKLLYQNTSDYFINSDWVKQKQNGVVRDKITLKYKVNRRGTVYITEELLWQVIGKAEKYFGRNRIYAGYNYKINSRLAIEPYFITERTYNKANGPQNRNFYYCLDLSYSF